MRIAVATIAPNITLPIWARLFRRSILPTVDECHFIVGSPIEEMRELARDVLSPWVSHLDVRLGYQSHGEALSELYRALPPTASAAVLEDDCFVTCDSDYVEDIWRRLPLVGGVMGSRLAKMPGHQNGEQPRFRDTYGTGLYPNMMFAHLAVLYACTDMDFTSRNYGDVGHMIGEQLHEHGIHTSLDAHLPQCRLSAYCGTDKVDPDTWEGPWLHVGEMSVAFRMERSPRRPGYFEAMGAYAAALETGGVREGECADIMRYHVGLNRKLWPEHREWFEQCVNLMRRVFAAGKEQHHAVRIKEEGQRQGQETVDR